MNKEELPFEETKTTRRGKDQAQGNVRRSSSDDEEYSSDSDEALFNSFAAKKAKKNKD